MNMRELNTLAVVCMLMAIVCSGILSFFGPSYMRMVIGSLLGVEFIAAAAGWLYTQGRLDERSTYENRPKNQPLNRILRDL
jgi:hypothetical protein